MRGHDQRGENESRERKAKRNGVEGEGGKGRSFGSENVLDRGRTETGEEEREEEKDHSMMTILRGDLTAQKMMRAARAKRKMMPPMKRAMYQPM